MWRHNKYFMSGNENNVSALFFPHRGPCLESRATVGGLGDPVLPPADDFGEVWVLAQHAVPQTDSGWQSLKCNPRRGSSVWFAWLDLWFYALQMCVWSCIQELIYHTLGRVAAFLPWSLKRLLFERAAFLPAWLSSIPNMQMFFCLLY